MKLFAKSIKRPVVLALFLSLLASVAFAGDSDPVRLASQETAWKRSVSLIESGQFDKANTLLDDLEDSGQIGDTVRDWLGEYVKQQHERAELNKADFDMYVGYAKKRIERGEFIEAMDWSIMALDVAADQKAFLKEAWLTELVDQAVREADIFRAEGDWHGSWDVYMRLNELFENHEAFKKREREALTHLRLDMMFEDGRKWKDRLERVRWDDAEHALMYIDHYYVREVDFRAMAIAGMEQLLTLASSQSAQQHFEGLKDDAYREEFKSRVASRLEQVRAADSVNRRMVVEYFRRVVKDINEETIQLPEELIVSELVRGAFEPLDEFTSVIWPVDAEEFEKHTNGEFIGVGVSIVPNNEDEIEISSPIEDTPAYRAGIQAGDVILKADDVDLSGASLNEAVKVITGPKGTPVTLTIRRGSEIIEVPLIRDVVKIYSVKGVKRQEDDETKWDHWLDRKLGIAYIRVTSFQKNTVEDLLQTLLALDSQGMRGLVLDLRGNPGGLLTAASSMAAMFLDSNQALVGTKGRLPNDSQIYRTDRRGPFVDLPLTVLVDEHSASASEIVSGAILDNHRGTVIGQRTYGKFSVQNLIPLGRSNARLKITTARYHLPSGASLHREPNATTWGVMPNISVPLVRKEMLNVYTLRRERERIGPVAPDDDAEDADKGDADPAEADDQKVTDAADGDKAEDDSKTDDPERIFSRFKLRSYSYFARLKIEGGVDAEDELEASDDSEKKDLVVKFGDDVLDVVAMDAAGKKAKVVGIKKFKGELEVTAVNDKGEPVLAETLKVGDRVAKHVTMPRLDEEDDNERPKIDPQLDTALLVMRVVLLGDLSPFQAIAGHDQVKDPVSAAAP